MIKVNSVIKMNFPKIKELTDAQVTALEHTAEEVRREVKDAQVFPRDTGNLQNESTFVDYSQARQGKVSLVSTAPYARRLYFHPEYHFQTKENPNAKGKWYEDWIPPNGPVSDFAPETFKKIYKRLTGI